MNDVHSKYKKMFSCQNQSPYYQIYQVSRHDYIADTTSKINITNNKKVDVTYFEKLKAYLILPLGYVVTTYLVLLISVMEIYCSNSFVIQYSTFNVFLYIFQAPDFHSYVSIKFHFSINHHNVSIFNVTRYRLYVHTKCTLADRWICRIFCYQLITNMMKNIISIQNVIDSRNTKISFSLLSKIPNSAFLFTIFKMINGASPLSIFHFQKNISFPSYNVSQYKNVQ